MITPERALELLQEFEQMLPELMTLHGRAIELSAKAGSNIFDIYQLVDIYQLTQLIIHSSLFPELTEKHQHFIYKFDQQIIKEFHKLGFNSNHQIVFDQ